MTVEQYRKQSPYRADEYLLLLRKLLPRGWPWGFEVRETTDVWQDRIYPSGDTVVEDSIGAADTVHDSLHADFDNATTWIGKYLSVFAEELRRLTDRVYEIVNESIPGLANETLPEWLDLTIANNTELELVRDSEDDQRALAHSKIYYQGKLVNDQFFIDYGQYLGYRLTIDEYPLESEVLSCSVYDGYDAGVCGTAVDPTAQANVLGCGQFGSFNVMEVSIICSIWDLNLDLIQSLFDYAVPAHVAIVWVEYDYYPFDDNLNDPSAWTLTTDTIDGLLSDILYHHDSVALDWCWLSRDFFDLSAAEAAYGTWTFWYAAWGGSGAQSGWVMPVASSAAAHNDSSQNGYVINFYPGGRVRFYRVDAGALTMLFGSAAGYPLGTMTEYTITRTATGVWTLYRGGAKQAVNAGTNPVTDNTYTESDYQVIQCGKRHQIGLSQRDGAFLNTFYPLGYTGVMR